MASGKPKPPPGGFAADLPGKRGGELGSDAPTRRLCCRPLSEWGGETPSWLPGSPSPHPAASPPTSLASGEVKLASDYRHPAALPPTSPAGGEVKAPSDSSSKRIVSITLLRRWSVDDAGILMTLNPLLPGRRSCADPILLRGRHRRSRPPALTSGRQIDEVRPNCELPSKLVAG